MIEYLILFFSTLSCVLSGIAFSLLRKIVKEQSGRESFDTMKLEENLNTRLRDLQMTQFSLRMPNYPRPSGVTRKK